MNKQKNKYYCPKCERLITTKKENVSEGYFGACLNCDEDFHKIELIKN